MPNIDCIFDIASELCPNSVSCSSTTSAGNLSILSTMIHVFEKISSLISNDPKTSSRTLRLLILMTRSLAVSPTPSKNVTNIDINSASAEISFVPQISTFH